MEIKGYPYYGSGIIAFAVAESDGIIQQRERRELMNLVREWSETIEVTFDIAEIIFSLLAKTNRARSLDYETGLEYIRKGRDYMTPQLKGRFVFLINDIAHSFPPDTAAEKELVKRFEKDLKHL